MRRQLSQTFRFLWRSVALCLMSGHKYLLQMRRCHFWLKPCLLQAWVKMLAGGNHCLTFHFFLSLVGVTSCRGAVLLGLPRAALLLHGCGLRVEMFCPPERLPQYSSRLRGNSNVNTLCLFSCALRHVPASGSLILAYVVGAGKVRVHRLRPIGHACMHVFAISS